MSSALDEFFAARDWTAIEAATGWSVVRDEEDSARVLLSLKARDGEPYQVQFLCDEYPQRAPSVAFVNAAGSKSDPRAWPRGDGEFFQEVKPPPWSFVCMPLTREGIALHADWLTSGVDVWNPARHTLMDLFNRMQRLLNGPYYQGRGA